MVSFLLLKSLDILSALPVSGQQFLVFVGQRNPVSRSGRLRIVFSNAFRRRHRRISSWLPDINTSGTAIPRNSAGRV